MKKVFLSLALIFVFSAYTLYVRILGADVPIISTLNNNKSDISLLLPTYNKTTENSTPVTNTTPSTPKSGDTKPTTPTPTTPTPPVINNGKYRDGSYTGPVADAYYGNVQVKAVISGGKITDVQFLDHPQGRQTSVRINERAMPYLTSEAIVAQDANVNTVSGASFTSAAFRESLSGALSKAKI